MHKTLSTTTASKMPYVDEQIKMQEQSKKRKRDEMSEMSEMSETEKVQRRFQSLFPRSIR
jgi:hypothetical protein